MTSPLNPKQIQLMMNLQLLSSLNAKPIYQPQVTLYPIMPDYIYPMNTQLSYQTMVSPHSTLMSYQETPITNDTSYRFMSYPKSYTTMSYHLQPNPMGISLNEGNDFIGKKTTRNTIIINDEEGINVKHHSAPIKIMNNKNMFETHLLKKQIEEREDDKKFKCGHNGCDLAYRTKKQRVAHHGKMDQECQKDTIALLRQIALVKEAFEEMCRNDKVDEKDKMRIKEKYEKLMKEISLDEYAAMICGSKINVKSICKED